jgi:hypothetical protein
MLLHKVESLQCENLNHFSYLKVPFTNQSYLSIVKVRSRYEANQVTSVVSLFQVEQDICGIFISS